MILLEWLPGLGLLVALLILLLLPPMTTWTGYVTRRLRVEVLDADTHHPIRDATVALGTVKELHANINTEQNIVLSTEPLPDHFIPRQITNQEGMAELLCEFNAEGCLGWSLTARGHFFLKGHLLIKAGGYAEQCVDITSLLSQAKYPLSTKAVSLSIKLSQGVKDQIHNLSLERSTVPHRLQLAY